MSNLVIVAIPDENDRVWKVSSEKVPHLTLLFLGDESKVSNLDQIMLFVEHAANTTLKRFYLPVDRRGEMGADQADVLFFKKGRYDYKAIRDFRVALLQDNNIKTAYDSATQFEGPWNPHLTLGYPAAPAKPDNTDRDFGFYDVGFNKVAVWTGDFDGPEFLLKDYWDEFDALESVPMDVAMSDLAHVGVKGMRWGVRKAVAGVKATSTFVKDVNFENRVESGAARKLVINAAHKDFKAKDLAPINAKPEYQAAKKLKNRLLNPKDPLTKQYRGEVKAAYINRLETTANSMKNASGTRQYTIRERGIELPAQGGALPKSKHFWDLSSRQVNHANGSGDFTRLEVLMDDDGFITDVQEAEVADDTMAQTADMGAEFLAHFGVKGMHWGQRKPPPTAVPISAMSRVPHGDARKTKIDTAGGQNHPAHEDAIKVAEARTKLKKSGSSALSNKELRDVATRLQLEQQVSQLTTGGGKKFVAGFLKNQGQQSAGRVVTRKAVAKGF